MKKIILAILMLVGVCLNGFSQSMSDSQVVEYVKEQQEKGTPQSQIVSQLMQRGVTVDQLNRIRRKYEQQNSVSLGGEDLVTGDRVVKENRMRKSNGETDQQSSPYLKKNEPKGQLTAKERAQQNNADKADMSAALNNIAPDAEMLEQLAYEMSANSVRKVFGRDIFNNKNLTFEPNMNIATPQNYVLGAGDVVFIEIYGTSQRTVEKTVSPDGTITIEGVGPISLGGLSVSQAKQRLRSELGSRYKSSRIDLALGQTKTIMVNVMGEVMNPGTYTLSAFATVFHALYIAGGTNDIGTLRNIKVYRKNKLVTTVDIYDYILNGKLTGNVKLSDNDVIVVSPYECLVNITGKVRRPMFYEMKKDETVGTLLDYAGGFTGDAYDKSVRLNRKAGGKYTVYNIGEFDMKTFRLADEDSLTVDSTFARYDNMVEIRGAVFRPGKYQMDGNINTVRKLIESADGVLENAFTAHAVMHRMKEDRTLEALSVDVAGILNGTVADIPLRNEDVLFIPTKQESQANNTLTIHGEVMFPGIYTYADNETVEDLIMQAGGLTDAASVMKVDVARRLKDPYATQAKDIIAETFSLKIKDGFVIDGEPGFKLQPFDEVYVRTSPAFSVQQNVQIVGEAAFPGTYTLSKKNERLSEIIAQAGGLTNTAYAKGARLERRITPEERLRMQSVQKMLAMQSGQKDTVDVAKMDFGNTYYVGIHLDKAIENPGSGYDIVLREGDKLIVPEYSSTVTVRGDVMYPNTVAYHEGKGLNYYVNQAGGWGTRAKKNHTYIIQMNGTVQRAKRGVKLMPGCEIIVPSKAEKKKMTTAETVALGSGVVSIATMIATLANLLK